MTPPAWLVQVLAGFLVLNVAGFFAVGALAMGSWCFGSGSQTGGQSFETGLCTPLYRVAALLAGLVAVGGAVVATLGLRASRKAADPAP